LSQIQSTEGLSAHEIAALVTILSERMSAEDGLSVFMLKESMARSGYTPIAVGLAVESLLRKGMIERYEEVDRENRDTYPACRLTSKGVDWLLDNQERFRMKKSQLGALELVAKTTAPITDEDIPF
jgi:predicted transcriptional regulator